MSSATAPLPIISHFHPSKSTMMGYPQSTDRPIYPSTNSYSRPLTAPHQTPGPGPGQLSVSVASPDRFVPKALPQSQSQPHSPFQSTLEHPSSESAYIQPQPQPPITPLSASHYPSHPPASSGSGSYFGVAQTPTDQPIPSPPPTGTSRPGSSGPNFTPDGVPIVPVGVSGGKMFRCRGYGDCDKVFTRSEHLARHVR